MEIEIVDKSSESTPINQGDLNVENGKRKNVDFEEALEYTGFGRYNINLIIVCGLALLATNSEAYSIGYVLPSAECDLQLTPTTKGLLTSSSFFGIMISSIFWGYLSDRQGRRNLMYINLLVAFMASAASSMVPSLWGFVVLRFITGICISGPSSIIFAYFGEFQSIKNRSKSIAIISMFIALALMSLPSLAWILLPTKFNFNFLGLVSFTSWRIFILINAIPNLIGAVGLLYLPESPKFLYHNGRIDEAYSIIKSMYATNSGNKEEDFPVESLDDQILLTKVKEKKENLANEIYNQVSSLFKPPSLKYSLTGCVLQAGGFAICSGLFLWYPDIINQLETKGGTSTLTVCQALATPVEKDEDISCNMTLNDNIFIQNLIIGGAYLVGYSVWGVIVKALGNRTVFMACMAISTASTVLLCFVGQKTVIDILFVLVLVLPGVCASVIIAIVVDVMPTHLCGIAISVIMTAGRLGSIASSSVVGVLLEWNCTATFILYAGILLACILLCLVFPKK